MEIRLERTTPEKVGVSSSAVLGFLKAVEKSAYRCGGAFGQYCVVDEEANVVIATNSDSFLKRSGLTESPRGTM